MPGRMDSRFGLKVSVVWIVMVAILVLVPDALEQWHVPLDLARVCGWVLASGIWVAVLEREWRERFGPVARFLLQVTAWLAAAMVAVYISEHARESYWR